MQRTRVRRLGVVGMEALASGGRPKCDLQRFSSAYRPTLPQQQQPTCWQPTKTCTSRSPVSQGTHTGLSPSSGFSSEGTYCLLKSVSVMFRTSSGTSCSKAGFEEQQGGGSSVGMQWRDGNGTQTVML